MLRVLCYGYGRTPAPANIMTEEGGKFISMPVTYFNGNNYAGWKRYFEHPQYTYVVAIVVISDMTTKRHEVSFLGAPPDDSASPVSIIHEVYQQMRNYWVKHGSREIPPYVLKKVFDEKAEAFDFRAPRAPKKNLGKRTKGNYTTTICLNAPFHHSKL